jgi:hypothetical protein
MQDSWHSKKDDQTQLPLSLIEKISDRGWVIKKTEQCKLRYDFSKRNIDWDMAHEESHHRHFFWNYFFEIISTVKGVNRWVAF